MPMKKNSNDGTTNYRATVIICYVVMLLFAIALPVIVKTSSNIQYRTIYSNYSVGEIAETNLYAKSSIDVLDEDATNAKKIEAKEKVLPVFSYSPLKTLEIINKANTVRNSFLKEDASTLYSVVGLTLASKILKNADSYILSLAYDLVKDICSVGFLCSSEIEGLMEQGYTSIIIGNEYNDSSISNSALSSVSVNKSVDILSNDYISSDNVTSYVSEKLVALASNLSSSQIILLEEIIYAIAEPNVFYDEELTNQKRMDAVVAISPVVISLTKGDLIIEKNRVVTASQMKLLDMLSSQGGNLSFQEIFGLFILDAVGLAFGLYVFGRFLGRNNLHYGQFHIILAVSYALSIVTTYFFVLWSSNFKIEFIASYYPIFFLPVFITMASSSKRLGIIATFMLSIPIATLPNASVMSLLYCLLCGTCAVLLVRFFNKRIDIVYQWFFSCVICSAVALLFVVIGGTDFSEIFVILLGVLVNVSAAYILLSFTLPIVERVFNLPTVFRLYELAYRDSPILTRLSQVAPGTYSHSRAVADLAEAGARAIGANALLARVGGLYHDIGKVMHPEYFVENQSGVNKHDEISPSLSVAVIKSHVKVGADKGKEVGLPPEVVKIIANHHGNDIIQYFYHEALESQAAVQDGKGESVKAEDYSYNADIPDFPECGIVMLADSIEAASRTVTPNAGKFLKLIDTISLGKIERGQLDNSGLTLHDIRVLSDSFVKSLVARYHSRIEYPDDDED